MILNTTCHIAIEKLKLLINKYPNNYDLGYNVRLFFKNNDYVISIPNDYDLGKKIRKSV